MSLASLGVHASPGPGFIIASSRENDPKKIKSGKPSISLDPQITTIPECRVSKNQLKGSNNQTTINANNVIININNQSKKEGLKNIIDDFHFKRNTLSMGKVQRSEASSKHDKFVRMPKVEPPLMSDSRRTMVRASMQTNPKSLASEKRVMSHELTKKKISKKITKQVTNIRNSYGFSHDDK